MKVVFGRVYDRTGDEDGFTLIETIIAVTIIFGSLLALAYTATIGFGYGDLARQKQAATGIANQIMEEVRGLAYDTLKKGLLTGDLSTADTNLKTSCPGDAVGVYRFISCLPGATPGSGEKITASASATNPTVPLVPYRGTINVRLGSTGGNSVPYTWNVYVTNDCPTIAAPSCLAVNPYRVTVWVTWTAGKSAPNKLVRIQSLFYSPSGCLSMTTHPFAAPCQPFFFGQATVPQGQITISTVNGGIQGLDFTSGDLLTGAVQANAQQEQLSHVQGGFTPVGVRLTEGAVTRTAGAIAETTTAADNDPGSSIVSPNPPPATLIPPPGESVTSPSGGGSNQITFSSPGGDTARSDSTTSAGGSYACPPPSDTAETDRKPCAGSRQQQGGPLYSDLAMNGYTVAVGVSRLAQVGVASNLPNKAFVNRVLLPSSPTSIPSSVCAPAANADGCIESSVYRRFGTINIGGLPSGMTAPPNWAGTNAWNGYFFSIVGYQDSAQAAAGRPAVPAATTPTVPAPTAPLPAGLVYYWNGTGYSVPEPVTSSSLSSLSIPPTEFTDMVTFPGHTVTVTMFTVSGSMAAAATAVNPSAAAASMTDASAQVTPPKATIAYQVKIDGNTVVDLQIAINLKQAEARGTYAPAPALGS